jgi:hypothetical protein
MIEIRPCVEGGRYVQFLTDTGDCPLCVSLDQLAQAA